MDLVDRLVARAQGASPLRLGSFSNLAVDARDDQWIDQCVNASSEREVRFATELLLRALHAADLIVTEIESQGPLLEFFAGTSRDILLYESLHFGVHALSDALCQMLPPDKTDALRRNLEVARTTASILGPQHIGDFDASRHGWDRAQRYLAHDSNLREMSDCLVGILVEARGATVIELLEASPDLEVGLEIEVALRSAVKTAIDRSIGEIAERLWRSYAERSDQSDFQPVFG